MTIKNKQISNPFSTGGGGNNFEVNIQASFVALMLTGGFAPCFPSCSVNKIKLQAKRDGYETDDLVVFATDSNNEERKILCQVKHSISITENNDVFRDVIQAAWTDFNNTKMFNRKKDFIALITGLLSADNLNDVRQILEWARHSENVSEFIQQVDLTYFSSQIKRDKLKAFRTNLTKANGEKPITDNELFEFLKCFHLLSYDLDVKSGVTLSLLHSLLGKCTQENVPSLWSRLIEEVMYVNQNAGTITLDSLPNDLKVAFKPPVYSVVPAEFSPDLSTKNHPDWKKHPNALTLARFNLFGSFDENNQADVEIIEQLII